MAIERMKLRIVFSILDCNAEGDGRGSAEPYLWAFYFKIDGSTATLDLNANNQLVLRGTSTNIGSPGSLGNLGTTDVDAFENVVLPRPSAATGHHSCWSRSRSARRPGPCIPISKPSVGSPDSWPP
jgi:hypothetical protein